jgi:hypothetical protein
MNRPKLADFIRKEHIEGIGEVATIDFPSYAFALEDYILYLEKAKR